MTLERGALLHKRYRIVEILGQGGMGSVYRAVDENLGVDCAVKENLFTTDEYARQFRLEAVILANLRHPNLPRVTDHFVIGDQGQYLVMDYIEGEDLRQRMERVGNITEDEAVLLGASMCDALTYLHTRKPPILHRDIKPGNVKITSEGHIFLVDFGLAKVLHGNQATTTGARAMTPGYSPPEQYGTARTDPRTDVYSLGATLYASLTGIIPEDGLARAMDNTQLTPLRKRNSKISRRLAAAIEKAMGIDPADRFQNAEEFKRLLLGAKSKTQRLPGEYMIQPPPQDADDSPEPSAIEKASQPLSSFGKNEASQGQEEAPEFKPRKRRKKKRIIPTLLMILLLLAAAIVGVVRFAPNLVPPDLMRYVPLVLLAPTPVPVVVPSVQPTAVPTETVSVIETPAITNTTVPPTIASTLVPTSTLPPVLESTVTPGTTNSTPIAGPTQLGGGFGQIAFASTRAGLPQIYLVNTDGTGLQAITNMDTGACQPSWSPDGSQLVFTSPCSARGEVNDSLYNNSSLYLINADGTRIKTLTTAPGQAYDPAWAPDGKRIAFTSLRDGRKEIYTLNVDSGVVTRLTTSTGDLENSQPVWSPSGDRIAYIVKRFGVYQVWAMSDTGQDNIQLARSGQELWDYLPVWLPDGQTIMFDEKNITTTTLPVLMSVRYVDQGTKDAIKVQLPRPMEDVEFSPDGLWLVFESTSDDGNRDIYFSTISGGNRTRLTDDPKVDFDPTWRPLK